MNPMRQASGSGAALRSDRTMWLCFRLVAEGEADRQAVAEGQLPGTSAIRGKMLSAIDLGSCRAFLPVFGLTQP